MNDVIKIAVLEDMPDIAENLQQIISAAPGLSLVAQYFTAEQALADFLENSQVDVFLVDLGLPGIGGLGFIRRAKELNSSAQFLVHTVSCSGKDMINTLAVGAVGYVLKGSSADELVNSLRVVAGGGCLLSPRMANELVRFFSDLNKPKDILTAREGEVLKGLKFGQTYEEIAQQLFVSIHTVHSHIKKIYRKLNVKNRDDAVKSAVLFKLVD